MSELRSDAAPGERFMQRPPSSVGHSRWRTIWKLLTAIDRGKIVPAMAFRNAVGLLLALALGALTSVPLGGSAAAWGALFASYSDGNDAYRHRAARMLAASVAVALAALVGGMAERYQLAVGIVAAAAALAAGMAVAFSQAAADIGMVSVVMLIVVSAQKSAPDTLLATTVLTLAGGLVQTTLSLSLWPVRRYEPERRALALLYQELGRTAARPMRIGEAPPATLRMSQAHAALSSLAEDRSDISLRYQALLAQAERARLRVIALLRLQMDLERQRAPGAQREELSRLLNTAGSALESVGAYLLGEAGQEPLRASVAALDALFERSRRAGSLEASSPEGDTAREQLSSMDALAGQLRAAERLATGTAPTDRGQAVEPQAWQSWRNGVTTFATTIRANLNWRSTVFRHAVRLAATVTVAGILGRATGWGFAYWIPLTVVLLLRPDFASTFSRGLQRVGGTLIGLIAATALFYVLPWNVAVQVTATGACVFLLRWLGPANYGFFAIFVTAAIVFMLALTGADPKLLITDRAIDTLIGGALALVAYAVWPTREPVENAMGVLLTAYRDYFGAVAKRHLGVQTDLAIADRMRMAARLARSNLEASIGRFAAEPSTDGKQMEMLGAMLASTHRLVHVVMALEMTEGSSTGGGPRQQLERFVADVQSTLSTLENTLRGRPVAAADWPDLRADYRALREAGDRGASGRALQSVGGDALVDSLNSLRDQILGWRQLRTAGH